MVYFALPIYNEEANIRPLIESIRNLMKNKDYRIVVVNDGSSDNSLNILNELKDDRMIIKSFKINMNIGGVFSSAIDAILADSKSDDDVMIIMESDQTSEVSLVEDMVAEIQGGNDVIIASRYQKGGMYRNFPLYRLIYSRGANYFLRKIFPIAPCVYDYSIFLRAYRIKVFRILVEYFGKSGIVQSKGFIANSEILIKISLFSSRIKEIPFVYNYGRKIGKSKMHIIRTINEYFVFVGYMRRIAGKVRRYAERA
jgi:dolichol-phosphate mannosyltransferase